MLDVWLPNDNVIHQVQWLPTELSFELLTVMKSSEQTERSIQIPKYLCTKLNEEWKLKWESNSIKLKMDS